MSITTAQKHDLMIQFNAHREEIYQGYVQTKDERKQEEEKQGSRAQKPQNEFSKLYK